MQKIARVLASVGFLAILVVLGSADYAFTKNRLVLPDTAAGTTGAGASSSTEGAAVEVQQGTDIATIMQSIGFTMQDGNEDNVLKEVIPTDRRVETKILLSGNDRVAFIAWTQSPDVKTYFSALKEALQASFSPAMHDLVDRTDEREGKPPRNVLAFTDPGLLEEKMIFVRVRQRLFEFHVAPGKDMQVNGLIDALTE